MSAPARRTRFSVRSTTVLGVPDSLPPSIRNSYGTVHSAGVTGSFAPWRLALVAVIGASNFCDQLQGKVMGRHPDPDQACPPVRIAGTVFRAGSTTVTGPGRNVVRNASIFGSTRATA